SRDTVLKTAHGAILRIPGGSIDAGGELRVRLEVKEAYNIGDMIRYGLTTQSNGQPLSSGGMIDIQPVGTSAAHTVRQITVSLPTNRIEENMQRYTGLPDEKGRINWTDPRPLSDTTGVDSSALANMLAQKEIAYGRSIFQANCAQCHSVRYTVTG